MDGYYYYHCDGDGDVSDDVWIASAVPVDHVCPVCDQWPFSGAPTEIALLFGHRAIDPGTSCSTCKSWKLFIFCINF